MRPDLEGLISKEEALARMLAAWEPQPETETVSLYEAEGRVLAEDQTARYDLPVVRASCMDGVAVRSADFAGGLPDTEHWKPGEDYVRADTGDDFDDAFDAVIAIEQVTLLPEGGLRLAPNTAAPKGLNVKPRGADVRRGTLLARKGTVLTGRDLAAVAMGGADAVPVVRRPRVAFLPTGSELVAAGAPLSRGQNFDSNSILAYHLLRQMGAEPVLHPLVPDDPAAIEAAFRALLPQADLVLVNAGTSKGEEDHCARLLAREGRVLFQGVAAVPGRPLNAALVEGKLVLNVSGPSFAAFYTLDWAVRGAVCRFLGVPVPRRQTVTARLKAPMQTPPFFSALQSLRLERRADGGFDAEPLPLRGPRSVGSAAVLTADAVYASHLGEKPHAAGEELEVELLRPLTE